MLQAMTKVVACVQKHFDVKALTLDAAGAWGLGM